MKTRVSTLLVLTVAACFAFHAQSDEPKGEPTELEFNTSSVEQELLETLAEVFEHRLAQFRSGRNAVGHATRINKELFDARISCVVASQRQVVAENYVARAKEIEGIAAENLQNGTGSSTELLEAKAARLKAILELAKYENVR